MGKSIIKMLLIFILLIIIVEKILIINNNNNKSKCDNNINKAYMLLFEENWNYKLKNAKCWNCEDKEDNLNG